MKIETQESTTLEGVTFRFNKSNAQTVYIQHPNASYGIFCFNDVGDLFLNSDYGIYGFAWRSFGEDFREFLADLNVDYLIGKFEINYIEVSGKRKMPEFRKEKVSILCQTFIEVLKQNPK